MEIIILIYFISYYIRLNLCKCVSALIKKSQTHTEEEITMNIQMKWLKSSECYTPPILRFISCSVLMGSSFVTATAIILRFKIYVFESVINFYVAVMFSGGEEKLDFANFWYFLLVYGGAGGLYVLAECWARKFAFLVGNNHSIFTGGSSDTFTSYNDKIVDLAKSSLCNINFSSQPSKIQYIALKYGSQTTQRKVQIPYPKKKATTFIFNVNA